MRNNRKILAAIALASALVLAGCWDDDDEPAVALPSTEVPASAAVSTASFFSYLMSLAANDETSEPLTINDSFAVPNDEANEPTALI